MKQFIVLITLIAAFSSCSSTNQPAVVPERTTVVATAYRTWQNGPNYVVTDSTVQFLEVNKYAKPNDVLRIEGLLYRIIDLPKQTLLDYEYAISMEDSILVIRDNTRGELTRMKLETTGNLCRFIYEDNE